MIDFGGECARQKARRSMSICGSGRILLCLEDARVGSLRVSMNKFRNGNKDKRKI